MPTFIGFVLFADKMKILSSGIVKFFGCIVNNSARLGVKQKL